MRRFTAYVTLIKSTGTARFVEAPVVLLLLLLLLLLEAISVEAPTRRPMALRRWDRPESTSTLETLLADQLIEAALL